MIQPRKGAVLLEPALVTPALSNAVSRSFFPQATFLTADVGNSVTLANNPAAALLIGLLGIVVGPTVTVGLTCSPVGSSGSW
jgi:hypothetical protein